MAVYLGFDSSTQSLTAIALAVEGGRREIVFDHTFTFDAELPQYGTRHGVLPGRDPLVRCSSPGMWADALDRMMGIIARSGAFDLADLRAISGSAQQHGSVYLGAGFPDRFRALNASQPPATQLGGIFTRDVAPIWMDASTAAECAAITEALGGMAAVARLTGSRAFERFTGPQIRRFSSEQPEAWDRTRRVHLVSSFLASLLAGVDAPIDHGDGAGMCLMDIRRWSWSPVALAATAPALESKLPRLAPSWEPAGRLSPYWVERHGFPACRVIAWSGDNPCSIVGAGLVEPGRVAVSLGTSDTIFGPMREPAFDATGSGCVFGSPTGTWLGLTGFRNGSLARERIRDAYRLDWRGFSQALRDTPAGNRDAIMLPWFDTEITPTVHEPGVRRFRLDPDDAAANVRAVVEAQMMSLCSHSAWMGITPHELRATGGAAANQDILQVLADVFDAPVIRFEVGNSACLGAALRAWHADALAEGQPVEWSEIVEGFVRPAGRPIQPIAGHVAVYDRLRRVHAACEAFVLGTGSEPLFK